MVGSSHRAGDRTADVPPAPQVYRENTTEAFTADRLTLYLWTVNARADLEKMKEMAVAAVITDQVGAAVRILHAGAGSNGGPPAGRGESCP